ncbi:hypothetical protein MMUR_38430 [Mycolicibacterium murale]|uniref:Mutator family transposase n=1 Tax=Mycolicibacterium murale TaxID=182220 RepID=A0A7I9WR87_9MYCO|nr:hypothetical protein MMUR_38430 [Mycolicibacterium murale]
MAAQALDPMYPIVYLDALVIKIRDGHQVRNKSAHIAVGVDMDGIRHVLGIWVQPTEERNSGLECALSWPIVASKTSSSPVWMG